MLRRLSVILVAVLLCCAPQIDARKSSKSVRQQRDKALQEVKLTDEQIRKSEQEITKSLRTLDALQVEIDACNRDIARLNAHIDSIKASQAAVNDSIALTEARIAKLQEAFAASLRSSRHSRVAMSHTAFIFASQTVSQAMRRLHTVKQFEKWRSRKASEINALQADLRVKLQRLGQLETESRQSLAALASQRTKLAERRSATDRIVVSLQGKTKELRRVLKNQQQRAASLDAELDRIIAQEIKEAEERRIAEEKRLAEERRKAEEQRLAEERRKAEEQRLAEEKKRQEEAARSSEQAKADKKSDNKKSDNKADKKSDKSTGTTKPQPDKSTAATTPPSTDTPKPKTPAVKTEPQLSAKFQENKGALPWPVEGSYSIQRRFGRQRHPSLPNVETENSGIDLLTTPGARVKSVFEGTVSAIICPDGYNNVVVVRHGNYVTVYANLGELSVRKGDKVSRGQVLGRVYIDPADDNRSILHFEIRNATNASHVTKENPETWLR